MINNPPSFEILLEFLLQEVRARGLHFLCSLLRNVSLSFSCNEIKVCLLGGVKFPQLNVLFQLSFLSQESFLCLNSVPILLIISIISHLVIYKFH